MTECKTETIQFHALGSREVRGQFDGGDISTDAGGLLLRETEKRTGILKQFARMFLMIIGDPKLHLGEGKGCRASWVAGAKMPTERIV